MGKFDKQLKYSIRKVSVGAASVVIGAFYLAMGAGVVHAETPTTGGGVSHSNTPPKYNTNKPNGLPGPNNQAVPAPNSVGENRDAGSSTENNETLDSAVTERKGSTVQPNQPGINTPKEGEHGAHDPNAHISFVDPDHDATVEEMWKIIQHMPDDFQNNERSYLRNMDTLGRELRFDKTAENPEGVPLKPGEIRELHDFGGWHAIDKDGTQGKFVIGRKNEQGYFTGWHKVGETSEGIPIMEQGGMLGADALDNIYVHEQALDRRFDYMLMLVKGRTRANRTETVADHSTYDPRTPNERSNLSNTEFNKLPLLEKDKFNKYSPGVVGYNGIEKKFTAFSTKYGSRVRVDFVTGYISDINGNKGSYRIVIKAQNSKGEETQVYDETISRVAEIVQNEELYKKGLNVEAAHANILKFLKDEFNYRVNKIKNPKVRANPLLGRTKEKDYTPEQQKVYDQIVEEATEEAKKQGDIVMNVTEDFLSIAKSGKRDSEWKKTFTNTAQSTAKLSNDLNNLLKNADKDTHNTPTWLSSGSSQAKADDRAYRLLTTLIPGAKKITYHVNDDQLEVETDKYTYTAARNGSKEVGIQGSDIAATLSADAYNANPQTFERENTNTKANALNNGWARSDSEEFKHFSKFLGVDKGIERTNVISDEKLSAKIKEAVGPGYSKLGKAGYFSTADIPLGKDIVSYTVQVIPSDNERVGVNPQSSRIQYNMPILADFSVIQDTTGPSKELARRIIGKSNIPEDKKNKIIEEINRSKKTSEIRAAMSGDVKVKYQTVGGTVLTLKNTVKGQKETDIGKKDTDGTYIAQKDQLLGTDYDVRGKKLATLTAADGTRYKLKRALDDNSVEDGRLKTSAKDKDTMTSIEARTVIYVYEEDTTPPAPAEVDVTRTVKRTITYVKEDNVNGVIKRTTLEERKTENTVTFTGKEVTDTADNISYKDWTSTNSKFPKVDTPVLEGYIADIASVGEEEATTPTSTGDVTNITKEVVYKKLGSWVPRLPEGVTPPKDIDMTPKPYPNNPNDPTKPTNPVYPEPGTPTDPSTPKPPVIPYVPGYTPKIPTDPTKPEDPNTNPLVPVKPVDPADPKKGYKVPNIPNDPKKNFVIEYKPNPQKILIKVVNVTTGEEVELPKEKLEFNGVSDQVVTTEDREKVDNKIASLKQRGYIVSTKNPISKTTKYDTLDDSKKGEPTQVYKIVVNEPVTEDTEVRKVTRTIKYVKIDVQDNQEVTTELNTDSIKKREDKVEFSRDTTTSLATGLTKIGAWDQETKELPKVNTPVLEGYFANIASVAKNTVQPDTDSYEVTVEYRKIGSWVPRLPKGVTPPTGTDMTPKPYPNNPNDPTKPKYPDYPTTPPQPGEPTPKVPVIPYVPGYTPKVPTDPTKPEDPNTNPLVPLTPVDPNHPENGYKVPPVPETPGKDTPIKYEADPQKVVVKVFNTTTGTEVELPAEKVSIENGTPNTAIPTKSLEDKIKDLEKRGYTVDNKDLLKGKNFDTNKDVEGQDPSQVYKLLVRERTTTDTETKPVTRTIKYVKIDDSTGKEVEVENAQPTNTTTVNFTRNQTMNLVTGLTTNGKWSEKQTLGEVKTPVLEGYVADKATVEAAEVTGESQDIEEKVVYRKIGSWVPRLPEGVTPPTGTDMTPKPYPNNPNDPTKPTNPVYPEPGTPTDPSTPKPPVIPYVPGYTPKVPTDPTKPEDPNTNPLVPLTPVDPNHPENGYKVPPVPETPGKDTPIKYVKVPNTPSPEEPVKPTPESNHITIWVDENGKPLKPEKPGTHESGNIPGYRYITTVTKDGVTIHKFEKITPVEPNNPIPQKPTTPIPTPNTPEANTPTSETNRREELPNTGTEANANLAALGLLGALSGFGLLARKKKED